MPHFRSVIRVFGSASFSFLKQELNAAGSRCRREFDHLCNDDVKDY